MAVTFRATGGYANGAGAITPGLPTGTVAGDIMVMFIETANQAITVSGWTEAPNSPQSATDGSTDTRLTVFWKRCVDPATDNRTTSDSGDHQVGVILSFYGCAYSGDPFDVTAGSTDTTSDTSGSITGATTTLADCMIIAACAGGYDTGANTSDVTYSGWTNANLTSLTERADRTATAGDGGSIGVATGYKATAGDYGATTLTLANATVKGMWSGALYPELSINHNATQAITVTDTPQVAIPPNPNVTQAVTVYDGAQYYTDLIFVTESSTVAIVTPPPATSDSNFFLMFD